MRKAVLDIFGQRASKVSPKSTGFAGISSIGKSKKFTSYFYGNFRARQRRFFARS